MKIFQHGENKNNTKRSSVFMHTKDPSVTILENITGMRYRDDVIRSVLLLHVRANRGMKLARNYASCHPARSTLVMHVANSVQKLNLSELTRVIHQMCSAIHNSILHVLYIFYQRVHGTFL